MVPFAELPDLEWAILRPRDFIPIRAVSVSGEMKGILQWLEHAVAYHHKQE